MKSIKAVINDHNEKMKNDSNYNLRYKLFEAMKNDICVMSEHHDNITSLLEEIRTATPDILETYKAIYLD
jgi:hypothetical protein